MLFWTVKMEANGIEPIDWKRVSVWLETDMSINVRIGAVIFSSVELFNNSITCALVLSESIQTKMNGKKVDQNVIGSWLVSLFKNIVKSQIYCWSNQLICILIYCTHLAFYDIIKRMTIFIG